MHFDSTKDRYGSARFANFNDIHHAGFLKPRGFQIGFYENKPLYFDTDAPISIIAGSGGGKTSEILVKMAYSLLSQLIYDPKGEITAITTDAQYRYRKKHYYINPRRLHGLLCHRVNPLDILKAESPTLTADCTMIAEFLIPSQSGADDSYFINRGREWLKALLEFQVLKYGQTDFNRFSSLVNSIEGDISAWACILAEGEHHEKSDIRRSFGEMLAKQKNAKSEFGGITGELYNGLSFLADKQISDMLSGEDFSLDVLTHRHDKSNISLIVPAEEATALSGLMRVMIGVTTLYKSRSPESPPCEFILEEAPTLGNFKLLRDYLLPYGRGKGIRTVHVWQNIGQMKAHHGNHAISTFLSNSSVQCYFGVRDYETAQMVSNTLGMQTLHYADTVKQEDARRRKLHALGSVAGYGDPVHAFFDMGYHDYAENYLSRQQRPLMTASEILNMPNDRMLVITAGMCPPIYARKVPYWNRRDMAGLYFSNPYHPPLDSVHVKTWRGTVRRAVVECDVPEPLKTYPQYQNRRPFRFIRGYNPYS